MSFLKELWAFLRIRKKFWLLPILLLMTVFGGLIVLTQGSAVAPFIYTIFRLDHKNSWIPIAHVGISAFYHDSAAALVEDGEIAAARRNASRARNMMRRSLKTL